MTTTETTEPTTEPATGTTTGPQGGQEPTTGTGTTTGTPEGGQGATGDEGGSGEAARYRRRLRDTEAERDGLASQLEAMRRAEVDRLATGSTDGPRLHAAGDVFGPEYDLAGLLDDAGRVDPAAVRTAIESATAERTHLRADLAPHRRPAPDRSQGSGGSGRTADMGEDSGERWQTALRRR